MSAVGGPGSLGLDGVGLGTGAADAAVGVVVGIAGVVVAAEGVAATVGVVVGIVVVGAAVEAVGEGYHCDCRRV